MLSVAAEAEAAVEAAATTATAVGNPSMQTLRQRVWVPAMIPRVMLFPLVLVVLR